jgi:hypothetical protein
LVGFIEISWFRPPAWPDPIRKKASWPTSRFHQVQMSFEFEHGGHMTTGHIFIAASLDGYIARKSGELDWLMKQTTADEDHGWDAFMGAVDGLVMGRGTFEKVLTFGDWPQSPF